MFANEKVMNINNYIFNEDYVVMVIYNREKEKFEAILDFADYEKIKDKKWYAAYKKNADKYYVQHTNYLGTINGKAKYKLIYLHRYIMDEPKGLVIDHKNRNPLDNRRDNLVIKTSRKNLVNRCDNGNKNNTSGYRNVSWVNGKWIVQLQINGKNTRLGSFDDVHEAGKFASVMRLKYYGKP